MLRERAVSCCRAAAALRQPLTRFRPPQYLVSIPLRMFRLWAFTGMIAQVSAVRSPWPS